jgi:hypothetical protein
MRDERTYAARFASTQSRELELLLLFTRSGPVSSDSVLTLIQQGVNWEALAEAAEYHGLAPILYCGLDRTCPELAPVRIAERLRNCYRDSAKRHLVLTAKLFALLDVFESGGIAAMVLKGPALAESLYPDPALRPYSDLDLMVRKKDVPAALQVLTREGYKLDACLSRLPLHTLLSLKFELLLLHEHTAAVDIQWDTGSADDPFRFDAEILWRRLIPQRIAARGIPSLSPECQMLFLCVHGTKHLWSRLHWLGDVARLARAQPDWGAISDLATEAGCCTPLLLGLLLAQELLETPVPEAILECARRTPEIQRMASQLALRLNRIPPEEPESLETARFNAQLVNETLKKFRCYAALLRAPTEKELELVSLPEKLFFLYYPLRSARLVLKYGMRLTLR